VGQITVRGTLELTHEECGITDEIRVAPRGNAIQIVFESPPDGAEERVICSDELWSLLYPLAHP